MRTPSLPVFLPSHFPSRNVSQGQNQRCAKDLGGGEARLPRAADQRGDTRSPAEDSLLRGTPDDKFPEGKHMGIFPVVQRSQEQTVPNREVRWSSSCV